MSREEFLENYGHIEFNFSHCYKNMATYVLDSGAWFCFIPEYREEFSATECPKDFDMEGWGV